MTSNNNNFVINNIYNDHVLMRYLKDLNKLPMQIEELPKILLSQERRKYMHSFLDIPTNCNSEITNIKMTKFKKENIKKSKQFLNTIYKPLEIEKNNHNFTYSMLISLLVSNDLCMISYFLDSYSLVERWNTLQGW